MRKAKFAVLLALPFILLTACDEDDPVTPPEDEIPPGDETEAGGMEPGFDAPPDVSILPEGDAAPRKYYVDDVPVWVVSERVQYYGKNGKLVTESLRDYTRKTVRQAFGSLDDFLKRWNAADRKKAVIEELEEQGVLFEPLADEVGKDFGPFDLICHVAFGQPPLTRRERAENVKKRHVFAKYGEQSRRVIEILLEKYADEGLAAVEDIGVLAAPPFDQVGMPLELVKAFGGKRGYEAAVRDLETALYATG